MSRLSVVRAALVAAGAGVMLVPGAAGAQQTTTIDASALQSASCFGQASCTVEGVDLSVNSGSLVSKTLNGATGFGVSGGASGPEIDIGEILTVDAGEARNVLAIQFLFLFNGPEFGDKAEKAKVVADGTTYYLSVGNGTDDAPATWSGPGAVEKCGATTAAGTGCFKVTNPFPAAVSTLAFTAATGGTPHSGTGTNNSDYSIGFVDLEEENLLELLDCSGPDGCEVDEGFNFNSMNVTNPVGSTLARAIEVELLDCRYIPRTCLDQLPPTGDTPATDDAARQLLITKGVIKSLDAGGPNELKPATQLLNVTKLLPPEVTSLFDTSGTPPDGLPPLWIDSRWKGQLAKNHRIPGFFFKTDSGIRFSDVFEGEIDVSELTGSELGCFPTDNLLAWDVIATGSEVARSVGGRYIDTIINYDCVNPTKVKGTRLSLYSILETTPDTYGPTIKTPKAVVTVNNDAVFARLVESLWQDLGEVRANYACKQADPTPTGGQAPLSNATCNALAARWSDANKKIKDCVSKTFKPITGLALGICEYARERVEIFENALPASPSGPDPYNRLAELEGRVATFKHIWDTRFIPSLVLSGYCRERGACAP
jgi:hypothetical protein